MWDTPIDILEKKNCFFCFCFSLCSVLLTSHKAMVSVQKSQHLGPPQLFWPLVPLCFLLITTQLWCLAKKSASGSITINHSSKLVHFGNRDQPPELQSTGTANALLSASLQVQVLFDWLVSPEVINFIRYKISAMNSSVILGNIISDFFNIINRFLYFIF